VNRQTGRRAHPLESVRAQGLKAETESYWGRKCRLLQGTFQGLLPVHPNNSDRQKHNAAFTSTPWHKEGKWPQMRTLNSVASKQDAPAHGIPEQVSKMLSRLRMQSVLQIGPESCWETSHIPTDLHQIVR
jgi:hypothetical protein